MSVLEMGSNIADLLIFKELSNIHSIQTWLILVSILVFYVFFSESLYSVHQDIFSFHLEKKAQNTLQTLVCISKLF